MKAASRRGSAALEFGLLFPVLILIFGAIVDLSFYVTRMGLANSAARDACRTAAVVNDPDSPADGDELEIAGEQIGDLVLAQGLPSCTTCDVTVTWVNEASPNLDIVRCSATVPFAPMVGVVPGLTGPVVARFSQMSQEQED